MSIKSCKEVHLKTNNISGGKPVANQKTLCVKHSVFNATKPISRILYSIFSLFIRIFLYFLISASIDFTVFDMFSILNYIYFCLIIFYRAVANRWQTINLPPLNLVYTLWFTPPVQPATFRFERSSFY
jgi:hypothetical protein